MKDFFEVVVVGGDLTGLVTGALLAKRGFRVLVVEHDALPPTYAMGGFTLPRGPFAFLAAHAPHARAALSELALLPVVRQRATLSDPACQVAIPQHRLDVPLDRERWIHELSREFGQEASAAAAFSDAALATSQALTAVIDGEEFPPAPGWFSQNRFHRRVRHTRLAGPAGPDIDEAFRHHDGLRAVFAAPVRFAAHVDPERLTPLEFARLHAAWREGAGHFPGGCAEVRALLVDKLLAHGGTLRTERVERILSKRDRVVAIRTSRQSEEIGVDHVVLASDVASTLRLFADRRPVEAVLDAVGDPQTRFYRYTLNLVVRSEAVPEALGTHLFFVRDPKRPLVAENLLWMERGALEGEGVERLTVGALVPRRGIEDVSGYVGGLRDRVLASVGEVFPFLGRHTLLVDSPHDGRDAQDLAAGRTLPPPDAWSRGPATMRPVARYPTRHTLSLCALPVRSPLRNMVLANDQVAPGLGMEGHFAAAVTAAGVITRGDRRRAWLRRSRWIQPTP